jgi:hypothetical protein
VRDRQREDAEKHELDQAVAERADPARERIRLG